MSKTKKIDFTFEQFIEAIVTIIVNLVFWCVGVLAVSGCCLLFYNLLIRDLTGQPVSFLNACGIVGAFWAAKIIIKN